MGKQSLLNSAGEENILHVCCWVMSCDFLPTPKYDRQLERAPTRMTLTPLSTHPTSIHWRAPFYCDLSPGRVVGGWPAKIAPPRTHLHNLPHSRFHTSQQAPTKYFLCPRPMLKYSVCGGNTNIKTHWALVCPDCNILKSFRPGTPHLSWNCIKKIFKGLAS